MYSFTKPLPLDFLQPIEKCGTVEVLNYISRHYSSHRKQTIFKHANIYLPYGYDKGLKYNVVYLLHGWTGNAEDFVSLEPSKFRNLLDNLICYKKCLPFILVSPTWDCDNVEKEWDESCTEISCFWEEYINDLVPAVESKYSTFAQYTDMGNLKKSYDHRIVGGFSMGGIATWYIFQNIPSVQKYYISMSGECWDMNNNTPSNEVSNQMLPLIEMMHDLNFQFYQCVGTKDTRYKKVNDFMLSLISKLSESDKNKFKYILKENGSHTYRSAWEFVYNVIPAIFPYKSL